MMIHAYRPNELKRGIIVPIPKGNKDHSDPNNFRGITLMSSLSKTYDKILLERHEPWIKDQLSELQGVSQPNASSLLTAMLLKEAIKQNKVTYVALLDVKKAFDSVWIEGMLYKLLKMGMDKQLWAIINDSYKGFKCSINIAGGISDWFTPEQGVHQGDIFSMYLYCLYNNDLLRELREIPCSILIGNITVPSPAFVDDISIVAKSAASLQHYLDVA